MLKYNETLVYSVFNPYNLSSQTRCIMADDLDIEAMLEAPFRKVGVCILSLSIGVSVYVSVHFCYTPVFNQP